MVDKVLDITEEQMLADIAEQLKPWEKPEGWFTASEIAKVWGMGYSNAFDYLERLERDERVERHKRGKFVYWEMVGDGHTRQS